MAIPKRSILDAVKDPQERLALLERLESKLIHIPFCGCRIWIGAHDGNEYGKFSYKDVTYFTHRSIWELRRGRKVRPSLVLDHKCEIKACNNDDHLEEVTYNENTWRCKVWDRMIRCGNTGQFTGATDDPIESPTAPITGPIFEDHEFA